MLVIQNTHSVRNCIRALITSSVGLDTYFSLNGPALHSATALKVLKLKSDHESNLIHSEIQANSNDIIDSAPKSEPDVSDSSSDNRNFKIAPGILDRYLASFRIMYKTENLEGLSQEFSESKETVQDLAIGDGDPRKLLIEFFPRHASKYITFFNLADRLEKNGIGPSRENDNIAEDITVSENIIFFNVLTEVLTAEPINPNFLNELRTEFEDNNNNDITVTVTVKSQSQSQTVKTENNQSPLDHVSKKWQLAAKKIIICVDHILRGDTSLLQTEILDRFQEKLLAGAPGSEYDAKEFLVQLINSSNIGENPILAFLTIMEYVDRAKNGKATLPQSIESESDATFRIDIEGELPSDSGPLSTGLRELWKRNQELENNFKSDKTKHNGSLKKFPTASDFPQLTEEQVKAVTKFVVPRILIITLVIFALGPPINAEQNHEQLLMHYLRWAKRQQNLENDA